MKSILSFIPGLVVAAFAMVASTGCGPDGAFLKADVESLEISAEDTGDHAIGITASSSWIVNTLPVITDAQGNSTPAWFSVRYDGSDPGLLQVKADERNESEEDRTGEIVVVSGDGLILRIPFIQKAMDVRFEVTPESVEPFAARDDLTRTLTVSTNLAWEYEVVDATDWITAVKTEGEDGAPGTLTLTATETRSTETRSGSILLQPVNPTFQEDHNKTILIEQAGIDLVVYSEAMDYTYEIAIPADGGETALSVYSRATWNVTTDAPAERVSFDLTEGGSDLENGINVVMTVGPNTSTEEYTFTLTFESGGETYEYICRQQGGQPQVEEGI